MLFFLSRHDFLSLYRGTVDKVINVIYTDDYYIFTVFLANKYI
jgi:hypothetical protein